MKLPSLLLLAAASSLPAATLTVTSTADSGAGSLRHAVSIASNGDTITFGGAAFTGPENTVTIRLESGRITLNKALTVNGIANANGGNKIVITGDADASGGYTAGDSGALAISFANGSGTTTLNRLTFGHCGLPAGGAGGAVSSSGGNGGNSIVVTRCRFLSNTATNGGAWYGTDQDGTNPISFTNCRFDSNASLSVGGAVHLESVEGASFHSCEFTANTASGAGSGGALHANGSELIISRCSFTGNSSTSSGGAIRINNCATTLEASTWSGNSSRSAGALYLDQNLDPAVPVAIDHCTFSGNTALEHAGGILLAASTGVTLRHCTITENTSNSSSNLSTAALVLRSDAQARIEACLIAGNTDARTSGTKRPDVHLESGAAAISLGGNVIGDSAGSGTVFSGVADLDGTAANPIAPGVLPLADNGGPTLTHALQPLAAAVGFAGDSTAAEDQRGEPRPSGGARDAGAFERQLISFADWAADRLSSYPSSDRQANDDPDGDGMSNGVEFIQGTAPAVAGLPLDSMERDANHAWYSFTISNEADLDTLSVDIEESDNLSLWQPLSLNGKGLGALFDSANASRTRYRLPVSTAGRPSHFIRMNVRPLQMGN